MQPGSVVSKCLKWGLIGAVAAAVVHSAPSPAAAQPPSEPPAPRPAMAATPEPTGPVLSVEFPGGTLVDYIAAIRAAAAPEVLNVVLPEEAASLSIPPIRLENVTAWTALRAIRWAAEGGADVQVVSWTPHGTAAAFAIAYSRPQRPFQMPVQVAKPEVAVVSLRDLIDPPDADPALGITPMSADIILSSVETAMALALGDQAAPELRFHKDSGLLIIRGTGQQVGMVDRLVEEIRKDQQRRWAVNAERARADAAARFRAERASRRFDEAQAGLRAAREHLEDVRKSFEKDQATSEDLLRAERIVERAEREYEELRREHREATDAASVPAVARGGSASSGPHSLATLQQAITELQRRIEALESRLQTPSPAGPR